MRSHAWTVLRSLLSACVLLLPFVALYQWQAQVALPDQTRQAAGFVSGQAVVTSYGSGVPQTITEGVIAVGDTVRAVDTVRLTFREGTTLVLYPGAVVALKAETPEDGTVVVVQEAGRVDVDTSNPRFRLEAPSLTLQVEQARFRVEVDASGDSYVLAEQGLLFGQAEGETLRVAAGESLRTGVGRRAKLQSITPVVLPPPPPPPPRTPTPTVTPVPPTLPPQRVHVITQGDTLSYLATIYDTTVDAIIQANNIEDANMLSIGQKLIIPNK